ncbi:class I adenylate-forming enzyme family protein [Sphingomonas sp. SUN039]|uniref:class I adenylate-forming enzyme family protein n=1 Tax=Sphingomonas sp. SUN039 TaxID=2937787 RepID=UPI0021641A69|nr:class I adenylate-forming enzyme family protein [Sphingomonas sp. SUN039]UVO54752.1 acyl--CoA ligase [Sphingomonas sp. SUN039]
MPSELDLRIDRAIGALSVEGGPLPLGSFTLPCGVDVPVIAAAPPTLIGYFAHFCAQHGDADFLVDGDERLSFATVHAEAVKVAHALVGGYGVKKGDRIGIAMRNAPSWVVLYMGILMAGGVATLLNGWWQGGELCDGIAAVDAKLVFADPPRAKRVAECGRETGFEIVLVDVALPLGEAMEPVLARGGADAGLPDVGPDDLATILFTSGSTGQSKGAYSTHRAVVQGTFNYIAMALMMLQIGTEDGTIKEPRPQHAVLMTVPLFHVTGEIPMLLVSFAIGRKMVMMAKWNALEAMKLIEGEKVTNFTGVPLMSWEILNHPERGNYDLSTVQSFAAGGAPRPPEHVRRLNDEMPAPPALGYGLTETNAVGCGSFSSNYLDKPNSTGRASKPLVDVAILDDDGKPQAQGERGEISIRSVANFSGYWNNPTATAACMTADGYFRTGDIGYLDPDGYLFIVDRKKDIIIRGGENISCQEVEAAIYAHPAIAEACVFGLPDERLGEIVGAIVHVHPGEHLSEEALLFFLGEQLAAFKVPARLWFEADPLPKLGTEKIDKVGLRAKYRAVHEAEAKQTA